MTGKQILVVEDEKPIRDMIAFGLRRAGFEVFEAEDATAARGAIADRRPDLMLVDWMLPDQSGLDLTRAIRRNKETEDLPVREGKVLFEIEMKHSGLAIEKGKLALIFEYFLARRFIDHEFAIDDVPAI